MSKRVSNKKGRQRVPPARSTSGWARHRANQRRAEIQKRVAEMKGIAGHPRSRFNVGPEGVRPKGDIV